MNAPGFPYSNARILAEPAEVYHRRRINEVNNGGMKILGNQSGAHFAAWVADPEAGKETPALRFGKALHVAVLEPELFERVYCFLPADAPLRPTEAMLKAYAKGTSGDSSRDRVEWWRAWEHDNHGRIDLAAKDYDTIARMGESARRHPLIAPMLEGGEREVTLRWTEAVTLPDGDVVELECKTRLDLLQRALKLALDLKSTADASPIGFAKSITSFRYHVQHCHAGEGAKACGIELEHFAFVAIETEPPYVCAPYMIDAAAEERGYQLREQAMVKQAQCLRDGTWPGYSDDRITELTLPGWAYSPL